MKSIKISVFLGLSLDGFIAGPNGELDWLGIIDTPAEETGYTDLMNSVDCMVIGRNSYDSMLALGEWPYEGKRVIVLTSRPATSQYGEEFFNGALTDLIRMLEKENIKHVYLDGGQAARQGFDANLVDELTLSWLPIMLGTGIPLFEQTPHQCKWRLAFSRSFSSGLVQAKYILN